MSASGTPAISVAKIPPAYQTEAVRQLYLSVKGVALLPIFPTLLVVGTWSNVPLAIALLWLSGSVAIMETRRRLCSRYFRTAVAEHDAARWGRYMTWTTAMDGISWGLAGILFYVPDNLPLQMLLLTLIVGIPAGSIYSTSWWPESHRAFAFSSVGLTAVGMIARGSMGEIAMGAGLFTYLVILYFIMREAHASAMETIALRFERHDLIEQLQREKEVAERANLAKSKFLAAASHDLRQPLHAMSLFVAAMEDSARYPETKDMIGNVQRCTTALESLLQTLLDISKIDAGVIEPSPEPFRLAPLLERLGTEFAPQAQAGGLILAVQCPDATVISDPALVERILRNLINNAIRYTPAGRIDIRARSMGDNVAVEVSDTGIGIPADQQERVFEEFVQLGNPERDRSKGLGLGLAIVRRLAALLEAPLGLKSLSGEGSTFSLTLPAGDPAQVLERIPTAEAPPNSLIGLTVAVIDDEADVRAGMCTLLEGWGCRVLAGEDAASIVELSGAAGIVPEIVLADYRLRDHATGVDAIRTLRDRFQTDIPAAIVTGDTAPERLAEAQASGHLLLHKPLRPAKLRVLLQNLRYASA